MSIASVADPSRPAPSGSGFAALGVPDDLIAVLARGGIVAPTEVQSVTLPDALAGRDVAGQAPTGSGKTIAFGVPLAARVGAGRRHQPAGLVLVPTRELATQVAGALRPLLAVRRRTVATFFGGVGFGPQLQALRNGVDVAVACPGRLEDLRTSGHLSLDGVRHLVVDEADRMADMGFLPALRRILAATATPRQSLLFSATLGGPVDDVVRQHLQDPARHIVGAGDDALARMSHRFEAVDAADRVRVCASLLAATDSAVVFVRTRHGAERLTRQLGQHGVRTAAIHGDRSQSQRQQALASFRAGTVRALVATDVAARGIHVDDVTCVVHFDLPADATDYVHRSGRTARAGASGQVVSLVTPDQHDSVRQLVDRLRLDAKLVGIRAGGRPPAAGGRRPGPRSGSARPGAPRRVSGGSEATRLRRRTSGARRTSRG